MTQTQRYWLIIAVLIALRFIAGAVLPLSCDETYYWLWSHYPSLGYFDDPPMIAYAIRIGAGIFGDTSFGLRFVPLLLSLIASWATWRAAVSLLQSEEAGLRAAVFFNATLMVAVETFAATPDAPGLAFAALFLLGLAKVAETEKGIWWLLVGVAGGLGLMTKNTAFFVGFGALVWLVITPSLRRWLASPWPYLGGALAILIFAPNLWWNAHNHWMTFGLQVTRMEMGGWGLGHTFEFFGSMLGLTTPFILILGLMTLGLATRYRDDPRVSIYAAMLWPTFLYFIWHSFRDRVQANWPSYIYPQLTIAAAYAWQRTDWAAWRARTVSVCRAAAIPFALACVAFVYLQAFFNIVPIGRSDPMTRLAGFGIPEVGAAVEKARIENHAGAILTSEYPNTGWFAFYTPGRPPLIQLFDDNRWLMTPVPSRALEEQPMIYVTETRHDMAQQIAQHFKSVKRLAYVNRMRSGKVTGTYVLYRVDGLKAGVVGRQPQP